MLYDKFIIELERTRLTNKNKKEIEILLMKNMLKIKLATHNYQIEDIMDICREEKEVMLYVFTKFVERVDVKNHWINDFYLLIEEEKEIGFFQLKFTRKPNNASINLLIKKEYRNKGYGKQSLELAFDRVFNFYGFHRLMAQVYSPNKNSIKLFSKYMKKEATLRDTQFLDGKYCDTLIYSILESEFKCNKNKKLITNN